MKTNHMSNSAIGKQRILHWKDWKFIIHYSSFSNNSTKAAIVFKLCGVLCQGSFSNQSCNAGRSVLWDMIFYLGEILFSLKTVETLPSSTWNDSFIYNCFIKRYLLFRNFFYLNVLFSEIPILLKVGKGNYLVLSWLLLISWVFCAINIVWFFSCIFVIYFTVVKYIFPVSLNYILIISGCLYRKMAVCSHT